MWCWGGGGSASGGGGGGGRGRIGGGNDIRGGNGKCGGACLGRGFGERALEGPSRGSSRQGGPEHTFFAAPFPLLLLLFRFVVVSMGVSSASGVVGTGVVGAGLVLVFFLVLDTGGCSVMCAGIGAVTDFGVYIAAGVVAFVEVGVVAFVEADVIAFVGAGVVTFAGEAVVGLSSAFCGDFIFFSSDFHPLLHCFWLGLVRLFFTFGLSDGDYGSCCCCSFCCDCGGCSS